MADVRNRNSSARRQSNRLQRRAPASIQIGPVSEWNVAIPLLSPLIQSPTESNLTAEIKACCPKSNKELMMASASADKPVVVMKKWQHPAAPFCYEPAPFLPFVRTGNLDR
ncbi:hypothetical protein ACJIZ3_017510 [Penstemon smallii]|uniref:Uncharacterized protein n=1 Tax=Penstemon smallii TaxID=265156 RepID=A0ABD3SWY3_9LAMI